MVDDTTWVFARGDFTLIALPKWRRSPQAGRGSTKANNHLAMARGGFFASADAIAEISGFMK
jgi:hypothetical protein